MSSNTKLQDNLRAAILAKPDAVLDDKDLMQALVTANEQARGDNVIDLRGIAMQRLEERLDRLEDTHRSVIAAAYENLAGTNQVHRAVIRMLEPAEFEDFLRTLGSDVVEILRVDRIKPCIHRDVIRFERGDFRLLGGDRSPEEALVAAGDGGQVSGAVQVLHHAGGHQHDREDERQRQQHACRDNQH